MVQRPWTRPAGPAPGATRRLCEGNARSLHPGDSNVGDSLAGKDEHKLPVEKKPSGSTDYSWAEFDSEAYFRQYYGEPHADDDDVVRRACAALRGAKPD